MDRCANGVPFSVLAAISSLTFGGRARKHVLHSCRLRDIRVLPLSVRRKHGRASTFETRVWIMMDAVIYSFGRVRRSAGYEKRRFDANYRIKERQYCRTKDRPGRNGALRGTYYGVRRYYRTRRMVIRDNNSPRRVCFGKSGGKKITKRLLRNK